MSVQGKFVTNFRHGNLRQKTEPPDFNSGGPGKSRLTGPAARVSSAYEIISGKIGKLIVCRGTGWSTGCPYFVELI